MGIVEQSSTDCDNHQRRILVVDGVGVVADTVVVLQPLLLQTAVAIAIARTACALSLHAMQESQKKVREMRSLKPWMAREL